MGIEANVPPRAREAVQEAPGEYGTGESTSNTGKRAKYGKLTNGLNTGIKRKIAALHAAGLKRKQIAQATKLSLSHVDALIALPAVRAESERLFMIWFMALMDSRIGDIPPHPGID